MQYINKLVNLIRRGAIEIYCSLKLLKIFSIQDLHEFI